MIKNLQFFGQLDINSLEDYYRKSVKIEGKEISIDINFKRNNIEESAFSTIDDFLKKIRELDKKNVEKYSKDFHDNGTTKEYLEFYLEELFDEELEELIDRKAKVEDQRLELLHKLELRRVGLYPDGKYDSKNFGVFDYSIKIEGEFCDQLLVLNTSEKGEVMEICWES